jgi:hypothetical protein
MSIQRSVLFSSVVKPFYRKNAALLGFFTYMMTLAVGRANGVGLLEYHYALIRGIMTSNSFMAVVLVAWLLYAIKCSQFIAATLQKPAFSYLYMLSLTNTRNLYWLLLQAQLVLFLPVLSYVIVMMGVGYYKHWYVQSNLLLLYNLAVCAVSARVHLYLLRNRGALAIKWKLPTLFKRKRYTNFLTRYILENHKMLLFVIKIYNCITLYLMLNDRNPARNEDLRMEALFFGVGMLGHGVLIHRLKEMENNRMSFYRGLPVSISRRFFQYAWLYFCLFIPEIIIIVSRTPGSLSYSEAAFFIFFGYGILLLLNSLQLYNYTGLKDYLKTVAQVFFAVIIAMIARQLYALVVLFLLLAVIIFFRRYYRFEPREINVLQ